MEDRWSTEFGQWLQDVGVDYVAEEIGVTPHAVYGWVAGRTKPDLDTAARLADLSRGRITVDDVARHRRDITR